MDASDEGSADFERLLREAGLSDREAEAVRTVALGLSAKKAAQLMGVTPSTVGTYRQRAYKKLGVSTRSEFQSLSQVGAWTAAAKRDTEIAVTANVAPGHTGPRAVEPHNKMPASPMATRRRALAAIACTAIALAVAMLVPKALHKGSGYLNSPSGTIDTDYGELPNVVGMRADAAASKVAQAGFCPLFEAQASELSSGKVIEVKDVRDAAELGTGTSAFCWGEGSTAAYDLKGSWKASVVLVVAT